MDKLQSRDKLKVKLYDQVIGLLTTDKNFRDKFVNACESEKEKSR